MDKSFLIIGVIALVIGVFAGHTAARGRHWAALWTGIFALAGVPFILDPSLDSASRCWNAQARAPYPSGQQTDQEEEACDSTATVFAIGLGGAAGIGIGLAIAELQSNADRRRRSTRVQLRTNDGAEPPPDP